MIPKLPDVSKEVEKAMKPMMNELGKISRHLEELVALQRQQAGAAVRES